MPSARAEEFRRVAARLGFERLRQAGSHERWIHPDGRAVTIPMHGGQERAIFERAPALFVNGGSFMTGEEQLDPGIYALINEDAHSTIWRFAKSSTARTCSRVMSG